VESLKVNFSVPEENTWLHFYKEFIDLPGKGPKYTISCLNTSSHSSGDIHKSAFVDTSTATYHCSVCGTYGPERFLVDIIGISREEANAKCSVYKQGIVKTQDTFHLNSTKGFSAPMYGIEQDIAEAASNLNADMAIVDEYIASRGISFETLQDWGVGWIPERVVKEGKQEECLAFPYYFNGSIATVKGRTFDGRKGAPYRSKLVPYGLNRLKDAKFAVIVEGETDTLITYQILKNKGMLKDVAVIGIPGAGTFSKEWTRFFAHLQSIVIVPQADTAAELMITSIMQYLDKTRIRVVELPWAFHDIGKDIADWLGQHSETEFVDLLPVFEEPRPYALTTTEARLIAQQEILWIIPNLIATREKFMIYGAPKTMKTFVAIDMARCIVQGEPVFGHKDWIPKAGKHKVLFIEEEGNEVQFFRRVDRCFGEGTKFQDNIMWIHKHGVRLDNPYSLDRLIEQMHEFNPDIIFFDPFKSLYSADENDNTAMGEFWHIVNQKLLQDFPDSSHVYIHHIPKSKAGERLTLYSARGAGIIAAELDGGIGLRPSTDDEEGLLASLEGREVVSAPGEMILSVDFDNFRFEIQGYKTADTPKQQKEGNMEKIYEYLLTKGEACSISDIAHNLDFTDGKTRTALKALMKEDRVFETVLKSDGGRKPKGYYT